MSAGEPSCEDVVEAKMVKDRDPHHKTASVTATKDKPKSGIQAPWPDQAARWEMSEAGAERDLGMHAKNPDWEKNW